MRRSLKFLLFWLGTWIAYTILGLPIPLWFLSAWGNKHQAYTADNIKYWNTIYWWKLLVVCGLVVLICGIAAFLSALKYIRSDDMLQKSDLQ